MARKTLTAIRLDPEVLSALGLQAEHSGLKLAQLFRDLLVGGPAAAAVMEVAHELSEKTGEPVGAALVLEQFIGFALIQRIRESKTPLHDSDFSSRTGRDLCAMYLAWSEACRKLDGGENPDRTLPKYTLEKYPRGGQWEKLGRVGYFALVWVGDELTKDAVLLAPGGFTDWLAGCGFSDPKKLKPKQRDGLRGLYETEIRRERTGETVLGLAVADAGQG